VALGLMRQWRMCVCAGCCLAAASLPAYGQSSSLFKKAAANYDPATAGQSVTQNGQMRSVLQKVSFFTVEPLPKRVYKVGDLVTVIVRHKSRYKHDGETDVERGVDLKAELKDWIRFKAQRLIPASMPEGDPKMDFKFSRSFKGEGTKNRTDEIITRVTAKIIDVMPNGTLVLQGGPDVIETDGEKQVITLTGTCRSEDIAPDNTILSTQLLECNFKRSSTGAVRDAMRRGWAYRLWDIIRPF